MKRSRQTSSFALLALLAVAHVASAQSVNVEIDTPSGTPGTGVPSILLGGPGFSPGVWAPSVAGFAGTIPVPILNGSMTGIRFTRSFTAGAAPFGFNNTNTTGDIELLMDDGDSFGVNQTVTYTFDTLAPGRYQVYTCAIAPDSPTFRTIISVAGATEIAQSIGGTMPVNAFALGVTHARHTVDVGAAGTIVITASSASAAANFGTVNGIQIKLIAPARVYVRSRTGTGDGLSWPGAFGTLTEALNYAAANTSVREIWMGQGTFTPSTTWIVGDPRSARFNLVDNVAVIGGFAGTETSLSQRGDPAAHPTILSGNIGSAGISTDNAYNVVYANVPTARLDGVRISNAYNTLNECGASCFQAYGGGIRHVSGTLTIEQSIIANNYAATSELAGFGGGIFSTGFLRMSRCLIENNQARFGAGMYLDGTNFIFNSRFHRNAAFLNGGAASSRGAGNTFANCVFAGNTAGDEPTIQGGAAISNGGLTSAINCTFVGNGGHPNAHVIFTNPFSEPGSTVSLTNCIIWENPTPPIYGAATASHCIIPGGFAGFLNIDADPSFWDAAGPDNLYGTADDNVTLRPNSPAIDSGRSSGSASDVFDYDNDNNRGEFIPVDLALLVRQFDDLGRPNINGEIYDRGAFEFHGRSCPSDFNRDAVVDFFDYLDFVGAFSAAESGADFNGDGVVDFFDYLDFVSEFSGGC